MAITGLRVSKWVFFGVCVMAGLLVSLVEAWSLSLASASTIWTATGAVGSMAAAVGAVYAARTALAAAEVPIESAKKLNLLHCRSIAPAIGYEFRRAGEEISEFIHQLNGVTVNEISKPALDYLAGGFLVRTTTLDRYIDKFQMFGEDGMAMTQASASIFNLRSRTLSWRDRILLELPNLRLIDEEAKKVRLLEAEARLTKSQIDGLAEILDGFGGGKSHWEV